MELEEFADAVNDGLTNANAIVTADLDFRGLTISPIGSTACPYGGCFDGGGHTFTGLKIESQGNYVGLFGVVGGGATIKNFVLDNTCSISGGAFVGIIGGSNGSGTITMECLGNEGTVTASKQNAGGIFGCNMSAASTPVFINCYVSGPVKGGRESGQITGYAARGQAINCYGSGTIEGYYYEDMSDAMLRGQPQSTNCYSTTPDRCAIIVTQDQVASGELCHLLNQNNGRVIPVWFQTLGEDDHPVLDPDHGIVRLAEDGTYFNEDTGTGIMAKDEGQSVKDNVFNLAGQHIQSGKSSGSKLQRGIHIIRSSNGKARKVVTR